MEKHLEIYHQKVKCESCDEELEMNRIPYHLYYILLLENMIVYSDQLSVNIALLKYHLLNMKNIIFIVLHKL